MPGNSRSAKLLALYSGVDDGIGVDGHQHEGSRRSGSSPYESGKRKQYGLKKLRKKFGAGLAPTIDTSIVLSNVGALDRDWDLTPSFGNITPKTAVCVATEELETYYAECDDDDEEEQKRSRSVAMSVLIGAILKADAVYSEKKRNYEARLEDCVQLYVAALRKACKILLKESDNLRRLADLEDSDEETVALLMAEGTLKANLAGDLSRLLGCASRIGSDRFKMRAFLKQHITQIINDCVL